MLTIEGNTQKEETTMSIQLFVGGPDASEKTIQDLQEWVNGEPGLRANLEPRPAEAGHMGALSGVLSVILGSAAVVNLVQSIHVWIKARRPKLKITIRKDGSMVEIDAENLDNLDKR